VINGGSSLIPPPRHEIDGEQFFCFNGQKLKTKNGTAKLSLLMMTATVSCQTARNNVVVINLHVFTNYETA
jgi:hypothetical protein